LVFDAEEAMNTLVLNEIIYTEFEPAVLKVTTPVPEDIFNFTEILQNKLEEHLDNNSPDAPSLTDLVSQ